MTEFNAGNWLGCIRNHDFGCMAGYGDGNVRFFNAIFNAGYLYVLPNALDYFHVLITKISVD